MTPHPAHRHGAHQHSARRRGACPSLTAPMQTGDGLIARLTPATGALSAVQLQTIATLSARHGNGRIEITNRGNLQFRGLSRRSAPLLACEIAKAGIVARTGIAIDVSPLSGFELDERRGARLLAAQLNAALDQSDWADLLAPKLSIVVENGGAFPLSDLIADIRLVAARQGDDDIWQVFIAGNAIGDSAPRARYLGFCQSDLAAVSTVLALLELLALQGGSAARCRDLTDADLAKLDLADQDCDLLNPGTQAAPLQPTTTMPAPPIGLRPLRGGKYAVIAALEFGTISAQTLAGFAQACGDIAARATPADQIRPAPGKCLAVIMPDQRSAAALVSRAAELGLITNPNDPRLRFVTCSGAPACASAHIDTHRLARAIIKHSTGITCPQTHHPLAGPIHISACEKCCARPGATAYEIIAGPEGNCTLQQGTQPLRPTSLKELPALITQLESRRHDEL